MKSIILTLFRKNTTALAVIGAALLVALGSWFLLDRANGRLNTSGDVSKLVFSPQGDMLAAAIDGGTIQLWSIPQRHLLRTLPGFHSFSWNPNGKQITALSADNILSIWQTSDGQELGKIFVQHHIADIAWSPDGTVIAVGAETGVIQIIDPRTFQEVKRIHTSMDALALLAWNSNGTMLAGEDRGGSVQFWSFPGGELLQTLIPPTYGNAFAFAFSHNDKLIATTVKETIYVWDISTGKLLYTLKGHTEYVSGLDFSPDSVWLASSAGVITDGNITDTSVRLWDLRDWHTSCCIRKT